MKKTKLVAWATSMFLFAGAVSILSLAKFEGSVQIGFTLLIAGLIQLTLAMLANEIESVLRKEK